MKDAKVAGYLRSPSLGGTGGTHHIKFHRAYSHAQKLCVFYGWIILTLCARVRCGVGEVFSLARPTFIKSLTKGLPNLFFTKRETVAVFPTPRNPKTASFRCNFVFGPPLEEADEAEERDRDIMLEPLWILMVLSCERKKMNEECHNVIHIPICRRVRTGTTVKYGTSMYQICTVLVRKQLPASTAPGMPRSSLAPPSSE